MEQVVIAGTAIRAMVMAAVELPAPIMLVAAVVRVTISVEVMVGIQEEVADRLTMVVAEAEAD